VLGIVVSLCNFTKGGSAIFTSVVKEESCNYRFLFGLEAKRNGEKEGRRTEQSQPGKKRNTRSSLLHSLPEQHHRYFMFTPALLTSMAVFFIF
jgi:hypothetical protein